MVILIRPEYIDAFPSRQAWYVATMTHLRKRVREGDLTEWQFANLRARAARLL